MAEKQSQGHYFSGFNTAIPVFLHVYAAIVA
jgi:hypothetical protein